MKLERAHDFLEYYVNFMALELDQRVRELTPIDRVLNIWIEEKEK
jgi:hypothetical protein